VRKRVYGLGSTLEANYDNTAASGTPVWALKKVRIYVPGADGVIGSREFDPAAPIGSQEKAFIYHYDHLGSIESITPFVPAGSGLAADSTGKPGRFSEDAWGQRRNPLTWSGAPTTTDDGGADSLTPRGFTGHEMLDDLGLVHMNGRIYDPLLGRFQSADAVVQFPGNLQSYNRYSYVQNHPLTLVDPTGHVIAIPVPLVLLGEGLTATGSTMIAAPAGIVLLAAWLGQNVPVKDPFAPLVEGIHRNAVAKLDRNAVAPAKTGDQGKIANTQNNMDAAKEKAPTSTAHPAPKAPDVQEGFTQTAASDVAHTESLPAANPANTPNTTGTPVPTADVPLKSDMAQGIYEFPDQTNGGKPYVGQSSNTDKRLGNHEKAGRVQPGTATITEVAGGKTQREIAEHKRIQELTGGVPASKSDDVANKVDPIGPKRKHLLEDEKK
jgi:RHS repeat-associated protein